MPRPLVLFRPSNSGLASFCACFRYPVLGRSCPYASRHRGCGARTKNRPLFSRMKRTPCDYFFPPGAIQSFFANRQFLPNISHITHPERQPATISTIGNAPIGRFDAELTPTGSKNPCRCLHAAIPNQPRRAEQPKGKPYHSTRARFTRRDIEDG
ncbi:uncharacterized protein K444DRAFT_205080 [Hyaloscypha bicolor E]|uniref:Uncharacterized protein n=1 Tax=Hyaloscypha bicolor E TaxID=1095630 RepID=A0A2J6TP11_9HELO|nr:uncharacterized protein K444DRAFT_205080 [Hyaloscypha bicolor E]PMD64752.1 hypothetical protein K444DRAFT_205080 [Hyaloscypha bicolor E]